MNGAPLTRITKLLELTTSNHDGEALAAVRKANEALKQLGLSWTELLVERSLSPQDTSDTAPARHPTGRHKPPRTACWTAPDGTKWAVVFQVIYDHASLSDHWAGILDSVQAYYVDRGYLSPKQADLVLKFFTAALEQAAA